MDDATGWCSGCLRTLDEIAGWAQWPDADRRAVVRLLGARRLEWRRQHGTGPDSGGPGSAGGGQGPA